jgi:hypothetical protein
MNRLTKLLLSGIATLSLSCTNPNTNNVKYITTYDLNKDGHHDLFMFEARKEGSGIYMYEGGKIDEGRKLVSISRKPEHLMFEDSNGDDIEDIRYTIKSTLPLIRVYHTYASYQNENGQFSEPKIVVEWKKSKSAAKYTN